MSVQDIIKKSVIEGFAVTDMSTTKIMVTLTVTFLVSVYIFFVYKIQTKSIFYSKEFNITIAAVAVVTAAIVLAMQSNIVVSLGMVGALSIVRFRSAIKNPLDLLYLFWSISVGIVCGAGMYEIAIITSLGVTITVGLLGLIPINRPPYLLVVRSDDMEVEKALAPVLKKEAKKYYVKSRNISAKQISLIVELRTSSPEELVRKCSEMAPSAEVSLMSHDGEIRG